jgi:hypothetical protein
MRTHNENKIRAPGRIAVQSISLVEIDRFIEEHRLRCLWFLRPDYRPGTVAERLDALERISRCADIDAFRRAAEFREWLLQSSSGGSVGS